MPKNIVVCSDGTGNSGIKDRGTNVFKLFEAIDLNGHRADPGLCPQIAIYDDGVGTSGLLPLKLLGGAFGVGLARNVRQLYTGLVRIYEPGDRIFLFGFSRGAFTARTLAGMIAKCGVLNRSQLTTTDDMRSAVKKAYETYRRSYRTWFGNLLVRLGIQPSAAHALEQFKAKHATDDSATIHFIGVWDTVDSVGGPFHTADFVNLAIRRFKFPDRVLSPKVKRACQALSIDDARAAFEPRLWQHDSRIDQVWFAGVHSNVGGGYPKQGMSLVTLDWMLHGAGQEQLRVIRGDRDFYSEHGNVDDKLYDSRAGLGVFYRWKPRDMAALCRKQDVPPRLHISVVERIARGTDGYNPGTLAPRPEVVYTPSCHPEPAVAGAHNAALDGRCQASQAVLRAIFAVRGGELRQVRGTLFLGRLAYYLYVAAFLAVLGKGGWKLISALFNKDWRALLTVALEIAKDSTLMICLLAAFSVSGMLASFVDHKRSLVFSRFWHSAREELRAALGEDHWEERKK